MIIRLLRFLCLPRKREIPTVPSRPSPPNWWEMPFEPNWQPPQEAVAASLQSDKDFVRQRFIDGTTDRFRTNIHRRHIRFERCDLVLKWKYSSFTNCEFIGCRFPGSFFQQVKFSACTFRLCNFSHVTFQNCKFIAGCSFSDNSASPEELAVKATSIEASEFLSGLRTNVQFIPLTSDSTPEYQEHRLVEDKLELAQILYSSTREESDTDRFFDAYKQLVLCTLNWRIESHRFKPERHGHKPTKKARPTFLLKTLPYRGERLLITLSGFLTNWGRSLVRPILFFLLLLLIFSFAYFQLTPQASVKDPKTIYEAFIRAIDVTVVAGYTAHCRDEDLALRSLTLVNMLLGFFGIHSWYPSLPVVCCDDAFPFNRSKIYAPIRSACPGGDSRYD